MYSRIPGSRRNLFKLGLAALLGSVIAAGMTYYHGIIAGGLTEAISERFYDSFLFLNTAFVFCFSKWWFSTHTISDAWRNRLIFLGSVSFGVMLFEEITRNLTSHIRKNACIPAPHPVHRCCYLDMPRLCAGNHHHLLHKKIPYFNKLI